MRLLLDLVTHVLLKNTDDFKPDDFDSSLLFMNLEANTELSYFDQFLQYDGFNIYNDLKIKYARIPSLMKRLEAFSIKYLDSLGIGCDDNFDHSRVSMGYNN